MSYSTLFSGKTHAQIYKTYRPAYSSEIFSAISGVIDEWMDKSGPTVAIDIGCGSGQATSYLGSMFDFVVGIDPSLSQLEEAKSASICGARTDWIVGSDSYLPLANESCNYIQAFEAAHWFDLPQFYREVDRVLKPGGALVFGVYTTCDLLPSENEEVAKIVGLEAFDTFTADFASLYKYFFDHNLFPHHILSQVDNLYRDWKLPYPTDVRIEDIRMKETWDIGHFVSYLKTWSAWQKHIAKNGDSSLLDNLEKKWRNAFGDRNLVFSWPFAAIFSRKPL